MKERMYKYFSANSTRRYIDILQGLVNRYNNAKHSSIKMLKRVKNLMNLTYLEISMEMIFMMRFANLSLRLEIEYV